VVVGGLVWLTLRAVKWGKFPDSHDALRVQTIKRSSPSSLTTTFAINLLSHSFRGVKPSLVANSSPAQCRGQYKPLSRQTSVKDTDDEIVSSSWDLQVFLKHFLSLLCQITVVTGVFRAVFQPGRLSAPIVMEWHVPDKLVGLKQNISKMSNQWQCNQDFGERSATGAQLSIGLANRVLSLSSKQFKFSDASSNSG
jgi:hypothetical protein